jgi:3,4-dihydroxy 2-butanone 4-phosphate synthase/GTP cyclohydrolase II
MHTAGSYPAGVLCEIVDRSDGSMARTPLLMQFAKQHGLKIITIADLIRYRLRHEQLLQQVAATQLETRHGTFTAYCFRYAEQLLCAPLHRAVLVVAVLIHANAS